MQNKQEDSRDRFEATLAAKNNRITFGALNNRYVSETTHQPSINSDLRLINSFFEFLLSLDNATFINSIALKAFLDQIIDEAQEKNTIPEDVDVHELKQTDAVTVVSIATMIKRSLEGGKQLTITPSVEKHYVHFINAIKILALKKA